jgi:hypothetical protein
MNGFLAKRYPPAEPFLARSIIVLFTDLTPMEAAELSKVIDGYVRAIETAELAARLERLEQSQTPGRT